MQTQRGYLTPEELKRYPPRFVPIAGGQACGATENAARPNATATMQLGHWVVYQFLVRFVSAAGLPSTYGGYVSEMNPNTIPAPGVHDYAHPSLLLQVPVFTIPAAYNGLWVPLPAVPDFAGFVNIGGPYLMPMELSDFYIWAWLTNGAPGDTVDYAMVAVELPE